MASCPRNCPASLFEGSAAGISHILATYVVPLRRHAEPCRTPNAPHSSEIVKETYGRLHDIRRSHVYVSRPCCVVLHIGLWAFHRNASACKPSLDATGMTPMFFYPILEGRRRWDEARSSICGILRVFTVSACSPTVPEQTHSLQDMGSVFSLATVRSSWGPRSLLIGTSA